MQFDFNHPQAPRLRRPLLRLSQLLRLCLLVVLCTLSSAVHGQAHHLDDLISQLRNRPGFTLEPRDFGDTPSPTEMMARLKFHKQQETPLFDLLREAGVDIFSKLNDDEKKLAGKFVEDMILKEGMDSDKVSSLMEHMNISDAAREVLQNGIKRAGGESAISPEDRKELANEIRQQFLQQTKQPRDLRDDSTTNPGQNPSNTQAEEFAGGGLDQSLDERIKGIKRLIDQARKRSPVNEQERQPESGPAGDVSKEGRSLESQFDESNQRDQANRQLTREELAANDSNSPGNESSQINDAFATSPAKRELNKLLARETFRQLEKQLSEPQQKVVSEFKDKIQNGNVTKQEIDDLFSDLQSPQTSNQFGKQLDEAGKSLGLPADSRQQVQDAYGQLSGDERRSLQQAINGVDKDLLSSLMDGTDQEQADSQLAGPSSAQGTSSPDSFADRANNSQVDDLGREFLQDALETYNDPDSGYKLSNAFKRLKDQAEGVRSGRELANLGNISKRLFEDSSNIFDPNSQPQRTDGVKPGQRLDQLLIEAASKALQDDNASPEQQEESVFSNILNKALGVAIEQAVDVADKDATAPTQDVAADWNPSNQSPSSSDPNWQDPSNSSDSSSLFDSASSTPNPTNDGDESSPIDSIQETASALADSVLKTRFNWQTFFYVVGLIGLLVGGLYLLSQLLRPINEADAKQRELELKLADKSANPRDVVEAVDLFLLSRFGTASSWWNAKHAADQVSDVKPDWRDKIGSLFQVYRWSRYQADGNATVSPEQNELVGSTLRELNEAPIEAFETVKSPVKKAASHSTTSGEDRS